MSEPLVSLLIFNGIGHRLGLHQEGHVGVTRYTIKILRNEGFGDTSTCGLLQPDNGTNIMFPLAQNGHSDELLFALGVQNIDFV